MLSIEGEDSVIAVPKLEYSHNYFRRLEGEAGACADRFF